jgi:hypothetical protein
MNALSLLQGYFVACIHPIDPFSERHLIGRIVFLRKVLQISRRKKTLFFGHLVNVSLLYLKRSQEMAYPSG